VATIFEGVHDLARPVEVLTAVRYLLKRGGVANVMDEKVAETFTAPRDDLERLMGHVVLPDKVVCSYCLFFCLANGLADGPSVGTGISIRAGTVDSAGCPSLRQPPRSDLRCSPRR
jgi:hypothetical protein